jgi:Flp pilus assembly protein TadD
MTERLTYEFINLDKNSTELVLNWEKKQFPVKIEFAVDDIVMANAAEELKGTTGFAWQGFSSAANYSLQNKTNTEMGQQWAAQAAAMNPSFTTLNTQAAFLKLNGDNEAAAKVSAEALTMATEIEMNAYGYQLLNQGKNEEAIQAFKANTEKYPESANAWDSLGEGYALTGDEKNAVKAFKTALSLNPAPNVKANSEKYLKQFGKM